MGDTSDNVIVVPVEDVSGIVLKERTHYTYREIDDDFGNTYNTNEFNNSTICDLIALYVRGQKVLYTEAKTHCEQKLTFLMLPAIAITVACSVMSVVLKEYEYGTTITSSLNGINAFILALINYLKLDTRAEAHRTSAYKFDKLETDLEFNSGKLMFLTDFSAQLPKIVEKAEAQVREIKETNQFVLPESIRRTYPILYGTNLFAEVKLLIVEEMKYMNQLKDTLNKKLELEKANTKASSETLTTVKDTINNIVEQLIMYKKTYIRLDKEFASELKQNQTRSCCVYINPMGWFKV
jgi:hypothetical protein